MKNENKLSVILLALIILFSILILLMYLPHSNIKPTQSKNTLAEINFLETYDYKNLSAFENLILLNGSNELIFGCNKVLLPVYPIPPLENQTEIKLMSLYITQNAICGINNLTYNCTNVENRLYNLTYPIINKSLVFEFFNETKEGIIHEYQDMINISKKQNVSMPQYISSPLNYDIKILNNTQNTTSSMLTTLIKLKQVPSVININGALPAEGMPVYFMSPFFYFPAFKGCGNGTVFNLILNENESLSPEYLDILAMKNINLTNICIKYSGNPCNETEMNSTKSAFYVPV